MANQVDPATYGGAASSGGAAAHGASMVQAEQQSGSVAAATPVGHLGPYPPFHGRRVSWVAVSIIMAGFLIGGLSLIFGHHGPTWWLFWVGAGAAVLGLLITLATNTFEDWY
jgi:hypothetical protein